MFSFCVTGHRPNKLFGYDIHSEKYSKLLVTLKKAIYVLVRDKNKELGEKEFTIYTGMALGVDMLFAEAAFAAREYFSREENGGIKLNVIAAVPCSGQESKWKEESVKLYNEILGKCDKVIVLAEKYSSDCMQKRNEYMVDNSDFVFSVWDGTNGGTANCTRYAVGKNKPVVVISPKTYNMDYYVNPYIKLSA